MHIYLVRNSQNRNATTEQTLMAGYEQRPYDCFNCIMNHLDVQPTFLADIIRPNETCFVRDTMHNKQNNSIYENLPLSDLRNTWVEHDDAPPHKISCVTQFVRNTFQQQVIRRADVDMPLRRFRRQYEQLSQFERWRIIGMMEAWWSARRVAPSLDAPVSFQTLRRCLA
ncbi:hypothetical protein TNCV_4619241 [Trichonephila clavipes]|nr:hypothetical protein TNCV_4619241 [Trichonephila clavipes]